MHVVAQHPRDLRLLVQTLGEPPSGLNVLSERHIALGPQQRLTLRIIGESHWVTLESAGQRIDEVLACYQPRAEGALYTGAIPPAGALGVTAGDYTCSVWTVPLDAQVNAYGRGADTLEAVFPHPYGGADPPFTRLWWVHDPATDTLIWHSIHAYALLTGPLAVRSRTRLALRSATGTGPRVAGVSARATL
jgi:Protein of unknown function DUF2617